MTLEKCRWLAGLLLVTTGVIAHAAPDVERETLARLINELLVLRQLVAEAKLQADTDTRRQVDYSAIERDIEKIRAGILDALEVQIELPEQGIARIEGRY